VVGVKPPRNAKLGLAVALQLAAAAIGISIRTIVKTHVLLSMIASHVLTFPSVAGVRKRETSCAREEI